ncbi:diguanylate cyclase [Oceanimonas sp. CHS3-5]|uniref:sensor domain-containing diguanylate cyclase n=1 Tax=Oceanimonas sp. CHS3-5 TaxID=3068186 RepID=UPI00273EC1C9|nr:diguanylate cyclase [Oceanimonas sp. CHS3-5]MDP5292866.1 diguanylate cyclase [Oceanimonas sp. CHS3-5]
MQSRPFHLSESDKPLDNRLIRTIVAGVLALLLLITAMLAWGLYQDHRTSLQSAGERLQTQLRAFGSAVDIALVSADHVLHDTRHDLESHARALASPATLRRRLLMNLTAAPSLSSLTLFDDDGRVAASAGEGAGNRPSAPDWVMEGLRAGKASFTGIEHGRLGVAMLVTGTTDGQAGVLLATLDTVRIEAELESGDGFGGQHLMLLDNLGQPLLVAGDDTYLPLLLQRLERQLAANEFDAYGTRLVMGEQYLFALRQLGQQPIRAFAAIERERVLAGWRLRALLGCGGLGLMWLLSLAFLRHWHSSSLRERRVVNDLAHLYQAIEQMPSSVMITDLDRRIIYVNRAFLAHSGFTPDEVLGRKPGMLSSGRTPAATYRALWRELRKERSWEGEFINRTRAGNECIEKVMITPVRDMDGRVASYFAISQDVTEKHEFQTRLVRYREIVNAADELMALVGANYRYQQVNRRYLEYHQRERDEIEGHALWELYGEVLFKAQMKPRFDAALKGTAFVFETWMNFSGAGRRFCRMSGHPVAGEQGDIESIAINIADLTERKQSEEALRTSEQRFRALSEFSPMGVFEADASGHNIYSNRYYSDLLGRDTDTLLGAGWIEALHPEDRERVVASWNDAIAGQRREWHSEGRFVSAEGAVRWFRFAARRYGDVDAADARYIGMAMDITEQMEHQDILERKNRELERVSTTDALTGLANRGHMEQLLAREIHRYQRYGTGFAVVMLDVDHFKQVNDSCGHAVGDQVLRRLAALMREHTRRSDCPGRWGGEEFLILCPNTDVEGAYRLAEALRRRIEQEAFPVIGRRTCSFGVTAIGPGDQAREMLTRADEALYRAKSGGRNRVETSEAGAL